jgi:hypothetical protein
MGLGSHLRTLESGTNLILQEKPTKFRKKNNRISKRNEQPGFVNEMLEFGL